jgi:hypothetical protein
MNKKGKRGFKMKGFSPFNGKSSSPMKDIMEGVEPTYRDENPYESYDAGKADRDGDGRVSNAEHRTYMESRRGKVNPGKRSIANRKARGSYYDPKSVPAYHKMQTPVDDLTARERRLIEQAGGGINAEINPELMRGLDPGTHEGRRRVSRLNAYYRFNDKLQSGVLQTPEMYEKAYHQYQEQLSSMLDKRSTTNRISEYDNYDEFGVPHKQKIEEYRRQKRQAIGVDAKTGRYILPDTSGMSDKEIADLHAYNRMKAYEDRATSIDDLRARQKADEEASEKRRKEANKKAKKKARKKRIDQIRRSI